MGCDDGLPINIGEDNEYPWTSAKDTDGDLITDGTGTWSLKDRSGTVLGGPTAIVVVDASLGNYKAVIGNAVTAALKESRLYYLEITLSSVVAGLLGFRRIEVTAQYHATI